MRFLAAIVSASLVLSACGASQGGDGASTSATASPATTNSSGAGATASTESSNPQEGSGTVEVDRSLLSVEITFPADFIEFFSQGGDAREALSEIDVTEYESFEELPDGAVEVKMSRLQYGRLVSEQENRLRSFADELSSAGEGGVVGVTYNRALSEFDVTIDRAVADPSATVWVMIGLRIQYALYALIAGEGEEGDPALIRFIDSVSGEVFETYEGAQ